MRLCSVGAVTETWAIHSIDATVESMAVGISGAQIGWMEDRTVTTTVNNGVRRRLIRSIRGKRDGTGGCWQLPDSGIQVRQYLTQPHFLTSLDNRIPVVRAYQAIHYHSHAKKMKERYPVNPFPELALTEADRTSLEDLANAYIMTNLDLCVKFMNLGRKVDPRRWKPLKEKKGLKIYSERLESVGLATADEATGAGLPTILCVGTKEGKLDDLMFGIISEDLETMRLRASYADSFSAAAVLDGVVMPTLEDPFRSLVVKWMELDIPFNSTGIIKNRDYIYLEGIGIVKNADGERFGYSLLHSVNFPQTSSLPNRVRGNISFIAYWRQISNNTMEMYATGIIDPQMKVSFASWSSR
ncbi:unnamed protein product [Phytophthora fragariaefolia]|uniref:Unnamed protein product n=1 Tax=Phytophthora fragariaefolia TaxID=1490495 RepID=A0A9W6XT39_9STRA|nr:unnamed protein product [Phytophthora fragariaefolia]